MTRRLVLTGVALTVALGASAPAEAANLRGSAKGLRVKVTTVKSGRFTDAVFNWRVRRCDSGQYSFRESTSVGVRGDRPGKRFRSTNPYSFRARGGYRIRVKARSRGRMLSRYRWVGTFRATAILRRDGRVVDRCRFPKRRWLASVPRARLELSSDPGDYILAGKSYTYVTPGDRIGASGDRRQVLFSAGGWDLIFKAPARRPLEPGRFTGARRAPFSGGRPGIELTGHGRGCNEITGRFTIERARFDRRGVRRFKASFEQHCEGGDPAARGTIDYRR